MTPARVEMTLPPELIETIVELVVARVLTELGASEPRSPYLTIKEAAELLRCRRHRIDALLSMGTLTRVKEGRRTLVAREEIDRYLAERT